MTEMTTTTATDLAARFPEAVTLDSRKGYSGYMVAPENLLEVARALRDEMGYDLLSSVTGVDYLPEGKLEVVYHFRDTTGGEPLSLHVQTGRENAEVPS